MIVTANPRENEVDIAKIAVESCKKVSESKKQKAIAVANKMLSIEKSMGVPDQFLGMSLAAACLESGFNPSAQGDWRVRKRRNKERRVAMAVGILQLWPFYIKAYGVDRRDVESSTKGWLKHIIRMVPKVKKQCRYRSVEKIWVAAWVTGIRYKKAGGRCREKPLHYRQLKKIRKLVQAERLKKYQRRDIRQGNP